MQTKTNITRSLTQLLQNIHQISISQCPDTRKCSHDCILHKIKFNVVFKNLTPISEIFQDQNRFRSLSRALTNEEKFQNFQEISHVWRHYWYFGRILSALSPTIAVIVTRGVRNPMKVWDIGFLKTEPNRPQNSKTKNSVSSVRFSKNPLRRFGDSFSRCFIDNSSCSMIGSTVKVFFFMPCRISALLVLSWTNSAQKYVICSVMHIKQHTVQKNRTKNQNCG